MNDVLPNRYLGKTGLSTSVLGLGGAPLGELFETLSEHQAETVVQTAFESGIDLFDTAPWYGHGLSEHRMGHYLRHQPRNDFSLSTKVGRIYSRPGDLENHSTTPWAGGLHFELRFDYSYDGIIRSYEDSLLRLGINCVDLLVVHDLDGHYHDVPQLQFHRDNLQLDGWRALDELRQKGELKGIGVGINDEKMMPYFLDHFDPDFFLVAMPYTLLDQSPLRHEFEACKQRNIGIVVGCPFASGILASGPVDGAVYNYQPADEQILDKTGQIEQVCYDYNITLQAAALQFPLGHSSVAAVIPGATVPKFVSANIQSMLMPIPDEFWEKLKGEGLILEDTPYPKHGWQNVREPAVKRDVLS